jgi:LysR family transcriptional regulator, regulator of abg operon
MLKRHHQGHEQYVMKLNHLRDVTAVAECGSLRAASRKLGIAQPAISRSIREIERELGVALFERRAKGAVLTAMGKIFLRRAKAAQAELRQAHEEIQQLKGISTGVLSIALSTGAHISLLPRVLKPFKTRFASVYVNIFEGLYPSVQGSLKDGTFDFYVGPLSDLLPSKEFVVERLFSNYRVVLGRRGHPFSHAKSLKELSGCGWIATSVTSQADTELGPVFEQYNLPSPKIEIQASSALSMIVAAANSDLLIMLPEQWLDLALTRGLLQRIAISERVPSAPMCILRRASLPLTPAAEYLFDLFRRAGKHYSTARRSKLADAKQVGRARAGAG